MSIFTIHKKGDALLAYLTENDYSHSYISWNNIAFFSPLTELQDDLKADLFMTWWTRYSNWQGSAPKGVEKGHIYSVIIWQVISSKEKHITYRSRIYKVLPFLRYVNSILNPASLDIPPKPPYVGNIFVPHYFTRQELSCFFENCDGLTANNSLSQRLRKKVVPVIFRLLYSTGLRVLEARMLNRCDVDFKTGVITVRQTKGHVEHFVVLHDSMRELLESYDFSIEKLLPGHKVLFPDEHDNYHRNKWLSDQFRACWYKQNTAIAYARELRHQYAIEKIKPQSCNVRLSCLRPFLKFISRRNLRYSSIYLSSRDVAFFKTDKPQVKSLSKNAVKTLLSIPDIRTFTGMRDYVLMSLMYTTGCRIDEVLSIRLRDLHLNVKDRPFVSILGKGSVRRSQYIPVHVFITSVSWNYF